MTWVLLILAGMLEIAWAVGLKYTHGLTRPWPTALTVLASIASFVFLALATRDERLPIGNAYAIWTGMGAAGTALLGMLLFAEPASAPRLACVALIVLGIVGLELSSPRPGTGPPAPVPRTVPDGPAAPPL